MAGKTKILICGDVEGQFNLFHKRIVSINSKSGPFDLLLCVGNFFGINNKEFEAILTGEKKLPLPTYILGPNKEEHCECYPDEEDAEICENLFYLGKRGVYMSSSGVRIAYLSGLSGEGDGNGYKHTIEDVKTLKDVCIRSNVNYKGVDVLLTSQWPTGISSDKKTEFSSDLSAWLCAQLKPRYHVSGLEGTFYERPPFRSNGDSDLQVVTRFLGLARLGNPKKEKCIYALSVTPVDKMKPSELLQRTTDETDSPFNLIELDAKVFKNKRKPDKSQQYFFDMSEESQDNRGGGGRGRQKRQKPVFDQTKCWFCLASPSVEKHLVVTVANSVYLALAKGGLVDEHLLICPIEHHQSVISLTRDVVDEIAKLKDAVRSFYKRENKVAVFFERNYKTSHMQIQAVPLPKAATKELKDIFMAEAEGHDFEMCELESHARLDQVIAGNVPYFTVDLPTGEVLYAKIQPKKGFPINFAREVLASGPVLDMPDRLEWKDCGMSREDEEMLVQRIRTDFEPFDLTD
ncbi:PREDICTED: CWF19-like protein 1 [Nicrophorus vespilloides]|uniref:CWF19-like protein 1 n=1 Tax=Nicrophorus vespilloides TaxID=110193 RepID=A0ABM1LZQ5_NICVS|nr:PREDICTED: CWF19-like protein 1 [Nicrophorus vespilloides]